MGWGRERWKGAGTERGVGLGGGKREGVGIECFFFVVWMCLCVFFFFVLEGKGWDGMGWNGMDTRCLSVVGWRVVCAFLWRFIFYLSSFEVVVRRAFYEGGTQCERWYIYLFYFIHLLWLHTVLTSPPCLLFPSVSCSLGPCVRDTWSLCQRRYRWFF